MKTNLLRKCNKAVEFIKFVCVLALFGGIGYAVTIYQPVLYAYVAASLIVAILVVWETIKESSK